MTANLADYLYILVDHKPVACTSYEEYTEWMAREKYGKAESGHHDGACRVGWTEFGEDIHISTVFLGIDHNFAPDGPPILFETMTFGIELDGEDTWRYITWNQAEAGHAAIVERVTLHHHPQRLNAST